jgi:hypothetical protein
MVDATNPSAKHFKAHISYIRRRDAHTYKYSIVSLRRKERRGEARMDISYVSTDTMRLIYFM